MKHSLWFACLTALLGTACSTGVHRNEVSKSVTAKANSVTHLGDSAIDITYVLGHSHRRFKAECRQDGVIAQIYLDRTIVKENGVDSAKYDEFVQRLLVFIDNPNRVPAEASSCRTPFIVTLRVGDQTKVASGCRSNDDGTLSRLIKDGEFLLYSKK